MNWEPGLNLYYRISMSFDTIYFDGLIRKSKILPTPQRSKKLVYTLLTLSKLDDILGFRWYVRGINKAGNFCFITLGTVKFHLRNKQNWVDFQMQADGKLSKIVFDEGCQLIFQFIRGYGICSEWSHVLKSCQTPSVEGIQLYVWLCTYMHMIVYIIFHVIMVHYTPGMGKIVPCNLI